MTGKPIAMPSIWGTVRPNPKFAADAVTMRLFGPGVADIEMANGSRVKNAPSTGASKPREKGGRGDAREEPPEKQGPRPSPAGPLYGYAIDLTTPALHPRGTRRR